MKIRLFGATALALAALSTSAMAEPFRLQTALDAPSALKLSGSVRARYETISGQARAGLPGSADLVNFRTILGAEYGRGPTKLHLELWDSRVYGGKPGGVVTGFEVNTLEFVQAFVSTELKLGNGTSGNLQLGRYLMDLGSRRLIAADDYRNTTNGYTGAKLDLKGKSGWTSTLFYTLPQIRRPEDQPAQLRNQVAFDKESFDFAVWGGLLARPVPGLGFVETTFVGLDEKDSLRRPTRNRHLRNIAGRVIRNPAPGKFDYEVEAIHQFGTIRASAAANAAKLDVSANFLHADAGYLLPGRWKARLSAEYDYATGDKGAGKYNRFDSIFGQRRADFTPAGLFNVLTRTNMVSPALRVEVVPSPRADAFVEARLLWLDSPTDIFAVSNVRDALGRSGQYAGEVVDGRFRYWLVPGQLRFEADAVWLRKGRFLLAAPNANRDRGNTAYLSLNMTAIF